MPFADRIFYIAKRIDEAFIFMFCQFEDVSQLFNLQAEWMQVGSIQPRPLRQFGPYGICRCERIGGKFSIFDMAFVLAGRLSVDQGRTSFQTLTDLFLPGEKCVLQMAGKPNPFETEILDQLNQTGMVALIRKTGGENN